MDISQENLTIVGLISVATAVISVGSAFAFKNSIDDLENKLKLVQQGQVMSDTLMNSAYSGVINLERFIKGREEGTKLIKRYHYFGGENNVVYTLQPNEKFFRISGPSGNHIDDVDAYYFMTDYIYREFQKREGLK